MFTGIYLGIVGAEILNIPFIRMDLVPLAVGFCGVLLIVMGGSAIIGENNKTEEEHIEENDERNIQIHEKSKSRAFDFMFNIMGLSLLVLAMLGYMNRVSFFCSHWLAFIL